MPLEILGVGATLGLSVISAAWYVGHVFGKVGGQLPLLVQEIREAREEMMGLRVDVSSLSTSVAVLESRMEEASNGRAYH